MKKRAAVFLFSAVLAAVLCACSPKSTAPASGAYRLNIGSAEAFAQSVVLAGDTFRFIFDPLSSYLNTGTVSVCGNFLTLTTADSQFSYRFEQIGSTLIFDADGSSPIRLTDTRFGFAPKDGDVFILAE